MRVLYIVTAFQRRKNDVITPWLTQTILYLRKKGIDVEVFTSSFKGLGNQEILGIPVWRFRYAPAKWEDLTHEEAVIERLKKGIRYKLLLPLYIISGSISIYRLLRKRKYDILHVHWPFPHIIFGAVGRYLFRIPIVSSFHGVELMWVKNKMRYFIPFLRWSLNISCRITVNSSFTKEHINEISEKQVDIIPFGTHFTGRGRIKRKRNKVPVILFVGRLVERKGVIYLIRAIKQVSRKKNVKLIIVGDGPERENLVKEAGDLVEKGIVEFAGRVSDEKLDNLYRTADMFVLPSCYDRRGDTEGLGVVLIEALAYGLPVIGSNVGGIPDIIIHNKTGLLVPEKAPDALSDAILYLLNNRKKAVSLGRAGRKYVEEKFNWEKIIKDIMDIYKSVVNTCK